MYHSTHGSIQLGIQEGLHVLLAVCIGHQPLPLTPNLAFDKARRTSQRCLEGDGEKPMARGIDNSIELTKAARARN